MCCALPAGCMPLMAIWRLLIRVGASNYLAVITRCSALSAAVTSHQTIRPMQWSCWHGLACTGQNQSFVNAGIALVSWSAQGYHQTAAVAVAACSAVAGASDRAPRKEPLDINNLLLRGCNLRKTDWVIGLAINVGNDSKIVQNMTKAPRKVQASATKSPANNMPLLGYCLAVLKWC